MQVYRKDFSVPEVNGQFDGFGWPTAGNGDGTADILTGAGPGGGPHVKAFSFPALDLLFEFYSGEETNPGGVFVS